MPHAIKFYTMLSMSESKDIEREGFGIGFWATADVAATAAPRQPWPKSLFQQRAEGFVAVLQALAEDAGAETVQDGSGFRIFCFHYTQILQR